MNQNLKSIAREQIKINPKDKITKTDILQNKNLLLFLGELNNMAIVNMCELLYPAKNHKSVTIF